MKKHPQSQFRKFFFSTFFLALAIAFTLAACTKKNEPSESSSKPSGRIVNLAIWGNYLAPAEQARFESLTGIKIHQTNYSSNEELLAKIQAGAGGIDIAIPSDYMVGIMIAQGFLAPLDRDQIPNWNEIDPQYLGQDYDPENKFSAPYAWSTAGIALHRDLFKSEIKSWKDLVSNPNLKDRVSLLDDAREVIAIGLRMNGLSVNATSKEDLERAKASLQTLKPQIKMFRSDVIDALIRKEVGIAHAFSTEALQAWKKTGGKVDYMIPEEGGTFAIDSSVILKNAPHPQEAHQLINFFLSVESNVQFVQNILAGPVLKKTRQNLPADLQSNKALFPPQEQLKNMERIHDLGKAGRDYDRLWTEFKSM